MDRIYLGLAFHNHQPVGNFPWVFEHAYRDSYLPMMEALERHPSVRVVLHYTGPLLDWLRQAHPDFLGRVRALVARGQVEVISGGYYEPILPIIPDADKIGQIRKMTEYVAREFGSHTEGMWLAERVWEPHLPLPLAEAGIGWTIVDDSHFFMVGLEPHDLLGCYISEEQGAAVKLFPTLKSLRYSIPWQSVDEVLAQLRGMASPEGDRIAVMGDDGEKFGTWPGTRAHCWGDAGWIDEFFTALEANADWVITVPLGEYARRYPPRGRIYLPTASYPEMMEWALPAHKSHEFHHLTHALEQQERADITRYMRGGFWRNFLVKYPESNTMQKKMLRVHDKVYRARQRGAEDGGLDDLWQAQCNCPYWHGVFGGLYLTDVRSAAFQHLIKAEREADRVLRGEAAWATVERSDLDRNGVDELAVESAAQTLYFDPADGGTLFEWDLRAVAFNVQSTLTRRPEAYHADLRQDEPPAAQAGAARVRSIHDAISSRDPEVRAALAYDRFRRNSLRDHFFPADLTLDGVRAVAYDEQADCAGQPYEATVEQSEEGVTVRLWRDTLLWQGDSAAPVRIEKRVAVPVDRCGMTVDYTLTNRGDGPAAGTLAPEWALNVLGGGGNPAAYVRVEGTEQRADSAGERDGVAVVSLGNRQLGVGLRLQIDPPVPLWWYPIQTVSNSEGGVERTYQGTCLLPLVEFFLLPGDSLSFRMTWTEEATGELP